MLFKILIIVLVFVALYSLGSGLYFLVKGSEGSDKLVKALTWRIGVSVTVFLLLMLAFLMGWIEPRPVSLT